MEMAVAGIQTRAGTLAMIAACRKRLPTLIRFLSTTVPTVENTSALIPVSRPLISEHVSPQFAIPIDTYHWVTSLTCSTSSSSTNGLTREQAEALIMVVQRLASHRLEEWNRSLVALPRLHQDLHLLRPLTHDLSLSAPVSTSSTTTTTTSGAVGSMKLENEQRARYERLQTELHLAADQLRDLVTAVRTDLALIVNGYRGEAREDSQKMELEMHKLEAMLASAAAAFKGQAEYAKLRSLYSFASMINLASGGV